MEDHNFIDFTVRIRFRIPSGDRVGIDQTEVVYQPAGRPEVTLRSGDVDRSIRESEWLVIQSSGWESENEAEAAAEPLTDALRRALARHSMGADFGHRTPQGRFFKSGLKRERLLYPWRTG